MRPLHPLLELVQTNLRRHLLWPRRGPLVVATSGGLDSVVLLRLLHQLSPAAGVPLVVAHAHHGLRPEADADADFVAALARSLALPLASERLPVRDAAEQSRESIEMAARRLRHAFLARVALEHSAERIALAHHAGDQAELFLLRLLRGSGGSGLGGMLPSSPSPADPRLTLIRPLLEVPKELLQDFAAAQHIVFREDATNADVSIPRNRVRHELLPLLRADYSPAIDTLLQRTAHLVGADADYVQAEARRWFQARRRRRFEDLHVALQRAIVREQLWQLGHDAGYELVERLRLNPNRVSADEKTTLRLAPGGMLEQAAPDTPTFNPGAVRLAITAPAGETAVESVCVKWSRTRSVSPPPKRQVPGRELFDALRVGPEIVFRHWRRGDRFRPLGMPRAAKLQDLFVNRKIPVAARRTLLVATTLAGEIFWVEGLPPGEAYKVTSATREKLIFTWRRDR